MARTAAPPASDWWQNRPLLIGLGAALVVVLLAFAGASGSSTQTLTGEFRLYDEDLAFLDDGDYCSGDGGYGDIGPSTQVKLRDGKGESLATGNLGAGEWDSSNDSCVFMWELSDVPEEDFYRLEIGRRGELEYTLDEMRSNDWNIETSIGL